MNTPKHATDEQIDEIWRLLEADIAATQPLPPLPAPGLRDWMMYNEEAA